MAGMSLGTIEGTVRIRSAVLAGIESAPMKPGMTEPFGRLSRIGGPVDHTSVRRNCTSLVPATVTRRAKTATNRCPAGTFRPGFKPAPSR
jgi:hypothetical protein